MQVESHLERLRARLLGKTGAPPANGEQDAPPVAARCVSLKPEHYDFAKFPEMREYGNTRWYYDNQGFEWNMFREHVGMASAEVEVAGRRMINFSSYNYLD